MRGETPVIRSSLAVSAALAVAALLGSAGSARAQAAANAWASCFASDTIQCSVAGRYYMDGTGGAERNPAWAKMAWERGCQNSDGASCRELGALAEAGTDAPPDANRAFALYRQGCQLGSMSSCHELARCHRAGVGVGVNVAEANRLDSWACEHGNADACVRMAAAHANGEGVAADESESRRLLARACELGHAGACLGSGASVHGVQAGGPSAPAPAAPTAPVPPAPIVNGAPPAPAASVQLGTARPAPPAYGQRPSMPSLTPQALEAGVQSVLPRLQQCHSRRSRRVALRGTVVVSWWVDARGRARDVVVQPTSTISDRWMQRCVRNAVDRTRFAPPGVDTAPVARTFGF